MAGILNSKERVLDTIFTDLGKKQIAKGRAKFKYVSLTDRHTFYQSGPDGEIADPSDRIYFEVANRPQDQIMLTTDEKGEILPYTGGEISITGKKVLSGTNQSWQKPVTGDAKEKIHNLLLGSIQNYRDQQIVGIRDIFDENRKFILSTSEANFFISETSPIPKSDVQTTTIESVESLFQDERLAHLDNFQFLPPVNRKRAGEESASQIGSFVSLGQKPVGIQALEKSLAARVGKVITFDETSRENNLICQIVEVLPNQVQKLSIIDAGVFPSSDLDSQGRHVFFVGKILTDDNENQTFVNIFTIIFD